MRFHEKFDIGQPLDSPHVLIIGVPGIHHPIAQAPSQCDHRRPGGLGQNPSKRARPERDRVRKCRGAYIRRVEVELRLGVGLPGSVSLNAGHDGQSDKYNAHQQCCAYRHNFSELARIAIILWEMIGMNFHYVSEIVRGTSIGKIGGETGQLRRRPLRETSRLISTTGQDDRVKTSSAHCTSKP